MNDKPIHVKPAFYSFCYEILKEIALQYGYNLVLHGSLNRDLDLIAIPWAEEIRSHDEMVEDFAEAIGGQIMSQSNRTLKNGKVVGDKFQIIQHGRIQYVINLNREGYMDKKTDKWTDPLYYLDISIIPSPTAKPLKRKTIPAIFRGHKK